MKTGSLCNLFLCLAIASVHALLAQPTGASSSSSTLTGLIAHYPLDGTAADTGPDHLNGLRFGATPATDRFGRAGGALHFNGISDYVDLGNPDRFNFTESFTAHLWVQMTKAEPRTYILGKYYSTGPFENSSHSYGIGMDDVGAAYGFVLGDGGMYTDLRPGTPLADVRWHALSLVYDHSSGVRLYVDGHLTSSADVPNLPAFTNNYPLLIGRISSGQFFAGNVDDVSLFNRALTDAEVQALYSSEAAGGPVPLQNATATFSQTDSGEFIASKMIDGIISENLGWSIYPNITTQTAVFETVQDLATSGETILTFSLFFNVVSVPGSTGHTLGRFRLSTTADSRDAFADGLQTGGDVSANWVPVKVISATAESGAALAIQSDGSLLVSGPVREEDLYTITATTSLDKITGIRLEALTDPSLPYGGPGREPLNGNFSVSEFLVSARPLVLIEDRTRPLIVINSPVEKKTQAAVINLEGVITDNVGVASAAWSLNGASRGALALENGRFSVPVNLGRGTNALQVTATDTSGNQSSIAITIIREPGRTLFVGPTPAVQEGARVVVPVQLESRGDVGGVTFDLAYNPNLLETPEVAWGPVLQNAFVQVNTNALGRVRASFALSGIPVPTGVVTIAEVSFHARSVPQPIDAPLQLSAPALVSVGGDPLSVGTDILSGVVRIAKRKYIGDNNGNDRLDVGDAVEIMRFVNQLTSPRFWDIPANDLNSNQQLDIGDVIRVLRAAAGLDPQPSANGRSARFQSLAADEALSSRQDSAATFFLTLDNSHPRVGEKITLRVNLSISPRPISGASFTLRYPTQAFRLEESTAPRTVGLVPANAISVWNISPAGTDYTIQDGAVSLAVASGNPWSTTEGTVAEFTFTTQPGVTNQSLWDLQLSGAELSSDFDIVGVADTQVTAYGRDMDAPVLSLTKPGNSTFTFSVSGKPGLHYRIEISSDLATWTERAVLVAEDGSLSVVEPLSSTNRARFYRAIQIAP